MAKVFHVFMSKPESDDVEQVRAESLASAVQAAHQLKVLNPRQHIYVMDGSKEIIYDLTKHSMTPKETGGPLETP